MEGKHKVEGDEGGEGYGDDGSPRSATPLKRSSSGNTATSPMKKANNPMVKIIKGIWDTMRANSAIANKVMQGEMRFESIKEVMALVVECGVLKESVEHFMAS